MIVLLLATLAFGGVLLLATRHRLLSRLALREIVRRRGQSALVVGGLMIASAAITSSLVGAESSRQSFLLDAYLSWGNVDVTASSGAAFFSPGVADALAADPRMRAATDGVAPAAQLVGSVADMTRRQTEPEVSVIGFDPGRQRAFGRYVLESGRATLGNDLGRRGVLISESLARRLRARPGDALVIRAGRAADRSASPALRVAGIARPTGPGAFGLRPAVFAPLSLVRRVTGIDGINVVWVSAKGGLIAGVRSGEAAAAAMRRVLAHVPNARRITVREAKRAAVEAAEDSTRFLRTMLVAMSLLIVAAGAALAVNLVTMLAEERRPRLGVLRALGLSRRRLVLMSTIEGAVYSLAAALVGTLSGIAGGRLVAARFAEAFDQFFGGSDSDFRFSLRLWTLAVAFAAGALVTLVTVIATARRTSRMSIPAAIRDLPEPAREPTRRWPGTALEALVAVGGVALLAVSGRLPRMVGGILVILAVSAVLRRRLPVRTHATVLGALLGGWAFFVTETLREPVVDITEFFAVFTLSVLLAVFGVSILASANLRAIEGAGSVLGAASTAVSRNLRAPLAYLARRPLRTGLTTGMFAVVMTILTLFSVFLFSFQPRYERDSAGYDVRVASTGSSSVALPATLLSQVRRSASLPTRAYLGPVRSTDFSVGSLFLPLYELRPELGGDQPVRLAQKDDRFRTDDGAWHAVLDNPRYVVSDFFGPGQKITLTSPRGPVTFEVVGGQQGGIVPGIMASPEALLPFKGLPVGDTILLDARTGVEPAALARRVEASLFSLAVDARTIRGLLEESYRANTTFFSVIDVLMRLGLVVGILSLGILGLRAIVERRHVIGVLRAIGYSKRSVMTGLIAEALVTATLGVLVGLFTGLVMGFLFMRQQVGMDAFGVHLPSLGSVLALVYAAAALVTFGPAWRASRLPPAEAVRYTE